MAYRIKVQPAQLRQSAQQLRQAANQIQDLSSRAINAYNRMDAESRSASGLGGRVSQAQTRAAALAQEALRLASYLDSRTNSFEQADRSGQSALYQSGALLRGLIDSGLSRLPLPLITNNQFLLGTLASAGSGISWGVSTLLDWKTANATTFKIGTTIVKDAKEIYDLKKTLDLVATLEFSKGSHYVDQVIIKGSAKAREAALFNAKTNHLRTVKGFTDPLSRGFSRQLFGGVTKVTSKAAIMTAVVTSVTKGIENYSVYKDDAQSWQKTTAATVADTFVTTVAVAGGTALGATAGGALLGGVLGAATGGLLAPVGVSIGTHVGGMLGGMAGGWVADKILESDFYKEHKDKWVQARADNIDDFVSAVKDTAKDIGETASRIGNSLQHTAQDTARKIDSAVSGATRGLRRLFGT